MSDERMREDAEYIYTEAIRACLPDTAVKDAIGDIRFGGGRLILVSVGKAAWQMAKSALEALDKRPDRGIVITKYGHSCGKLEDYEIYEAGHPVPDKNTYAATRRALQNVSGLCENDDVLFLLSGGGSSLFEAPLIDESEYEDINRQLLRSGAQISEINTVRKRLSSVKAGRFALHCAPAKVHGILLSDVLGDRIDVIASGPACADESTCEEAQKVIQTYGIKLSPHAQECMNTETPKQVPNAQNRIIGSVKLLCRAAMKAAEERNYRPILLNDALTEEARSAGEYLSEKALGNQNGTQSIALICGGETVVHVRGDGLGGRNQELVLSAVKGLANCKDTCLFSIGSDGTDGPTDAAGAYADESTADKLRAAGVDMEAALKNNDSYHALKAIGALIFTGATGTNVNDLSVALIRR